MIEKILQKNHGGNTCAMKATATLLCVMLFGSFSSTAEAYFVGTALTADAVFSTGTLDLVLDSTDTYTSPVLYPTDSAYASVSLYDAGSIASQYTASTTILGGQSACDYVSLVATSTSGGSYSGPIKNFAISATSTGDTWNYRFTIEAGAPPEVWGTTCFFKWTYSAWQKNFPAPTQGFINSEEKSGSVRIGKSVVLNEFLPNPTGADNASKPAGEWVELYNNSSVSVNLSGWALYDNTDSHELYILPANTNTGGTTIAPHGFLVIYRNGDSDFELNNSGDSVRLATGYPVASSVVVDSYAYSVSKPEGFSYARIPDGVGAWVDPVPTPGEPNADSQVADTPVKSESTSFLDNVLESFDSLIVPMDTTLPVLETKPEPESVNEEVPSETPTETPSAETEEQKENTEQNTEQKPVVLETGSQEELPEETTKPEEVVASGEAVPADVPPQEVLTPEPVVPVETPEIGATPEEDVQSPEALPPAEEPVPAPVDNPIE